MWIRTEPIDSIDDAFKDGQEGIDDPVLDANQFLIQPKFVWCAQSGCGDYYVLSTIECHQPCWC